MDRVVSLVAKRRAGWGSDWRGGREVRSYVLRLAIEAGVSVLEKEKVVGDLRGQKSLAFKGGVRKRRSR